MTYVFFSVYPGPPQQFPIFKLLKLYKLYNREINLVGKKYYSFLNVEEIIL